jgi:4-hydroxy-3-methylbut-2-enyl diphosphate reductase
MEIVLASPRGYCAGVDRAIDVVTIALDLYGPPVYVRHEIVHNRHVVESLRAKGAVFVDELSGVPEGSTLVFSAHGVAPAVRAEAKARGLRPIDATCPLVTKVHLEALRFAKAGYQIVLVGHAGHAEVEGTMGEAPDAMILVQSSPTWPRWKCATPTAWPTSRRRRSRSTRHGDPRGAQGAIPERARPGARGHLLRHDQSARPAVKQLAAECDLVLVVGSPTSSNSSRLREVAELTGRRRVPGRERRGRRSRVARGQEGDRRHRRRIDARASRAGPGQVARASSRTRRCATSRRSRRRCSSTCRATWRRTSSPRAAPSSC